MLLKRSRTHVEHISTAELVAHLRSGEVWVICGRRDCPYDHGRQVCLHPPLRDEEETP